MREGRRFVGGIRLLEDYIVKERTTTWGQYCDGEIVEVGGWVFDWVGREGRMGRYG